MLWTCAICAIHNSFASYDGDVIRACHANKTDCQWTQTQWLDHIEQALNSHFWVGKESNSLLFLFNNMWCKLHLKNRTFLFAFKTFSEETKIFVL